MGRFGRLPTVLVYCAMDYGYYRDALAGIAKYAGRKWRILITTDFPSANHLKGHHAVGFIGPITSPEREDIVRNAGIPGVNISSHLKTPRTAAVRPNNPVIGEIAADHLIDRGYRHFAVTDTSDKGYENDRVRGFVDRLAAQGYACTVLPRHLSEQGDDPRDPKALAALVKPVGIFMPHDRAAIRMLSKVVDANFNVPGDFAFVGVDNDVAFCTATLPNLTSIDPGSDIVGFKAAQVLDEMLANKRQPRAPILIAPRGVIARESTDLAKLNDPEIAGIVRYIREHACQGLAVKAVSEQFAMSRRTLERRFNQLLGRSVLDEIRRVQIEHARELLTQTDLKIETVSSRCGFEDFRCLIRQFRKHEGVPPGTFRRMRRMK